MEVNDELAVLRRAMPGGDRRDRRRRPRRRRVLPLARGPAGQAGVRRRDPQRRPGRHAVRAGGARAGAAPGHPGQRRRPARRRSRRTRAPPRCGCVRSSASEQEEQQHEQSSHADPVADPAVRRGGGRAGPPDGRPAPAYGGRADAVRRAGLDGAARRRRRAAALQHLDAAGVVRRRPRWSSRPPASPPASRAWRWTSTGCATRSGSPAPRRGSAWSRRAARPSCSSAPARSPAQPCADVGRALRINAEAAGQAGDPEPDAEDRHVPSASGRRPPATRPATRPAATPGRADRDGKKKNQLVHTSPSTDHRRPTEQPLPATPSAPRHPARLAAAPAARRASW